MQGAATPLGGFLTETEINEAETPLSASSGDAETASYDRRARADQLRLLYRQSVHGTYMSFGAGALWVALMWNVADRMALLVWIALKVAAVGARVVLFTTYFHSRPDDDAVLRWQRPYGLTLMPAVLVWGVGCVLVTPAAPLLYRAITFAVLIGMSGVAISSYLILERLTMVVLISLIAPIAVAFALDGRPTSLLLAGCGVFYLLTALRGVQVHSRTVRESFRLGHELADATRLADLRSVTDPLTGLLNRRGFLEAAERTLRESQSEERSSAALLIDLDDLKAINDGWGHAAGDAALVHLAKVVEARVRNSDICGRIGGDELAVLLAEASPHESRLVAEAIRRAVAERPASFAGRELPITVSVGLAADVDAIHDLLASADSALYAAKRGGKNRFAALAPASPEEPD